MDCRQIESSLPPFLDGETDAEVARQVQAHLDECPACAEAAAAGRLARDLLRSRADALREAAPFGLRTRLEARMRSERAAPSVLGWPARATAMAAAAAVVLVFIIGFELVPMRSAALYAAQVAIDHVRCLYLSAGTVEAEAGTNVEAAVREAYGWDVRLPPSSAEHGVTLLGVRRCPFGLGPHAHILYDAAGRPVSLYITPGRERGDRHVDTIGQAARVWSGHDRTYALVARGLAPDELDRLEAYFRAMAE